MVNRAITGHCSPIYEIKYFDRDGHLIRSPPKVAELRWGRKLDDVSRASIDYIISGENCCDQLGALEPHAHRLGVFRHGIMVWHGWIDDVFYGVDGVEIEAYDALQWGKQRKARTDFSFVNEDQTDIFVDVWNDGMDPDPIAAELLTFPSGVTETRDVRLAGMPRYVYDVVKEMMDSGLDVTVIGQKIIVGVIPTTKPIQLRLKDVQGDVKVVKKGSLYAGQITVDANEQLQAIYPPGPPGPGTLYPLVEEISRRGALETQEAADNVAKSRYEFSRRVPRLVLAQDSLVLQPNIDIEVNDLIPGVRLSIDTEGLCYATKQEFRLGTVDVTVAGGEEKIAITTQPVGARDSLDEAEDPI